MRNTPCSSLLQYDTRLLTVHSDSRVNKRPISRTQALQRGSLASPKQRIIYVGTKSPFMSVVSRARKALNNGPGGLRANSSSKGLPLAARVAALSTGITSTERQAEDGDRAEEVLIRGSGRAMAKTLEVAAWFTRESDVLVSLRTMSLEAVDDVVVDEDDAEAEGGFAAEEETRVRMVNCLEVGLSLR